MARYTGAVCKQCVRERQKLFLKGDRCFTAKCAVTRRDKILAPGQHGMRRKKMTNFITQLSEIQKTRRFYGVLESQFEMYYEKAVKQQGIAGENLLRILESRLDNVVYRMGFAMSRPEARQLVNHGHFTVNGSRVDIPSYLVKPGDEIGIKKASLNSTKFKAVLENNASKPVPKWLDSDREKGLGKVITLAEREDIDLPVQEHLIIEYYSK